ncbi:unnamed protein product [Kuraishia capsulata CBS 1993]|uniref:RNase III domain-containing protein n=1 Tax=Kuraishia capsulata CBS 1993 TaxID=1382522 RepID=W6MLQ9_9ASCO|nr:uncharacterized protein KUCA_T00003030001 [Kuraishia capsulata CBS 1993]CDK27053.1 unnamed protein product [Kuraishia capsulata CBS 1993]
MNFRSLGLVQRGFSPVVRLQQQQIRNLVVYRSSKSKGGIRNPDDYLTSGSRKYELNEDNLKHIKGYLSSIESGKYQLPDRLLLQVITHKSFAHGKLPYNEKLSILGYSLFSMTTAKFALHIAEVSKARDVVDVVNSTGFKLLNRNSMLDVFSSLTGLAKVVFWKNPEPLNLDGASALNKTVERNTVLALIGAIISQHGTKSAEEFVINEVIQQAVKSDYFQPLESTA